MRISFTKFKSSGGLGKRATFLDNKLKVETNIVMAQGWFETVECPWQEFGAQLQELKPAEAFSFGVCVKRTDQDPSGFLRNGRLVTKKVETAKNAPDMAARTKENFKYHALPCTNHNILMIDIDDFDINDFGLGLGDFADGAESSGTNGIKAAHNHLLTLYPDLGRLESGCWAIASAGAYLYNKETNEELRGLTGIHFYFAIPPELRINAVVEYIKVKNWVDNGPGYFKLNEHDYGVNLLERTFIDMAVFSPERFDFIGGCQCGDGIEQRRPDPLFIPSPEGQDNANPGAAGLFELNSAEVLAAKRNRETARLEAAKAADQRKAELRAAGKIKTIAGASFNMRGGNLSPGKDGYDGYGSDYSIGSGANDGFLGTLPGLFELKTSSGELVCVWELVFFPERWHGRTFYDPLHQDKGPNKAKFFWNKEADKGWRYIINTFVKGGGTWQLLCDVDGAREMISSTDPFEIQERLAKDASWYENLGDLNTETELPELLDLLKRKGAGNKSTLSANIGRAVWLDLEAERLSKLEELNQTFAYVTIEGRARIIEETATGFIIRSKADFLVHVENIKVPVWSANKKKMVSIGDVWLGWDGRREYAGLIFEPAIPYKEFDRAGRRYLNRYNGFTVDRKADRACGKELCGGKGCFRWFFDQIEPACANGEYMLSKKNTVGICTTACQESNWTYWLKTIHDVGCAGNIEHTRWVVDWLVDILQAPGGRNFRNGNPYKLDTWEQCSDRGEVGTDSDISNGLVVDVSHYKRSEVSLCLRGGQGTGKNSIIDPIIEILGSCAFTCTDMSSITGNFNSFMEDLLLLFANEAVWGGSKKEGNKLKDLITGETIKIEHKGINSYAARNFMRIYIASNSDWVIPAEHDERRYTIFNATNIYQKDRQWFAKVKAADVRELLDECLGWQITSNLFVNIETDALREQKGFGRDVVDDFLVMAYQEGWLWDSEGLGIPISNQRLCELFHSTSLNSRFQGTDQMLMRQVRKKLRDAGFEVKVGAKVPDRRGKFVYGIYTPSREDLLKNMPWLED